MTTLFSKSRQFLLRAGWAMSLALSFLGGMPSTAQAQGAAPAAPEVAARAYLLLDVTANQILASRTWTCLWSRPP
jgi:D-alanyl-D-alanine carboxypeptidase